MILGMSISIFTTVHVVLSLVGIATGVVVLLRQCASTRVSSLTVLFLASTIAANVTGLLFLLAAVRFGLGHAFGIASLVVLAATVLALYRYRSPGPWRWIYVAGATIALYLNAFVETQGRSRTRTPEAIPIRLNTTCTIVKVDIDMPRIKTLLLPRHLAIPGSPDDRGLHRGVRRLRNQALVMTTSRYSLGTTSVPSVTVLNLLSRAWRSFSSASPAGSSSAANALTTGP